MNTTDLFSVQPIIKEKREVMVPVYDEYFKKEEKVPGVTFVFETPVPRANQMDYGYGGIRVIHQPRFQIMQVTPHDKQRIDQIILLKIAKSLGADLVKIRERFTGDWKGKKEDCEIAHYSISYGPKSGEWDEDVEPIKTIDNDLKMEPVMCYGITQYEHNTIVHTRPIILNDFLLNLYR